MLLRPGWLYGDWPQYSPALYNSGKLRMFIFFNNSPETKNDELRIQELLKKLRENAITDEEWSEFVELTHQDDLGNGGEVD